MINLDFNPHFSSEAIEDEKSLKNFFSLLREGKESSFFSYAPDETELESWKKVADKFSHKKTFIHVGIGGSSLGPRTLVESLLPSHQQKNFRFLDNVDPDHIENLMDDIDPQTTLVYVVSKSGKTAETLAVFSHLCNWLKSFRITQEDWSNIFVIASDDNEGDLRLIAKEHKLQSLTIPTQLGGRFSALSAVGLFPLLWADLDPKDLLAGAENFKNQVAEDPSFLKLASHLSHNHEKYPQTVLMPYSSRLHAFTAWFVQLWAESLGKKFNHEKKEVYKGLTPVGAIGATDQHSIVQLFAEGPRDKNLIFLKVQNFENDSPIKSELESATLKRINTITLGELLNIEFDATYRSLGEKQVPCCKLEIPRLNRESLGHLILFFETLTALVGYHLDINPFDQPGVEDGKRYTYELVDQMRNKNSLC